MAPVHEQAVGHARDAPSASRAAPTATHGFDVAANPATMRALLAGADQGTRQRLIASVQARHGNAAVQRLLAPHLPVQRWAVGLRASTTDCAVVVSYLDANSPHRASSGWAKTNVRFSWGGDPAFTQDGDVISATVSNPTVTKQMSVDMPVWAPTDPAMRRAWTAMTTALRAHEAVHEGIANTWETTLRTNLTELTVTVPRRTLAAFNAAVQAEWNGWLAQHQAEQTAIDPYTALLDCSEGGTGESSAPPVGPGGGGGEGGELEGLDEEPDLGGF